MDEKWTGLWKELDRDAEWTTGLEIFASYLKRSHLTM